MNTFTILEISVFTFYLWSTANILMTDKNLFSASLKVCIHSGNKNVLQNLQNRWNFEKRLMDRIRGIDGRTKRYDWKKRDMTNATYGRENWVTRSNHLLINLLF